MNTEFDFNGDVLKVVNEGEAHAAFLILSEESDLSVVSAYGNKYIQYRDNEHDNYPVIGVLVGKDEPSVQIYSSGVVYTLPLSKVVKFAELVGTVISNV